jgi:CheY-like chemotaxis protein
MALITGTVHALDLRQVAQAGIARIFQKPFHLEEILAWLQLLGVASTPPP